MIINTYHYIILESNVGRKINRRLNIALTKICDLMSVSFWKIINICKNYDA